MLKTSAKNPEDVLKKIKTEYEAIDFLEEARANPKIIENFLSSQEARAFAKILSEKKEKEKIVKKTIKIKSFSQTGINDIKSALESAKNVEIRYLGSSKFSISSKGKDFKDANNKVQSAIEQVKNKAHERKLIFESEEK